MRTSLIKGLVDSLGERGRIALPLLEQLLPVIPLTHLDRLGSPCGLPLRSVNVTGPVAGKRSGVIYSAPQGSIIRIDGLMSVAADANVSFGKLLSTIEFNDVYNIVDWRKRTGADAVGQVSAIRTGETELAATWLAGLSMTTIGFAPTDEWWPGPVYLTGGAALALWHSADNQPGTFQVIGELFELG